VSLLRATGAVIAEVSIAERFEGGYEFEDLVRFMSAHGFRLSSFLSVTHQRGELRPRFADVLFTRPPPGCGGERRVEADPPDVR
jgi:hypothetical protein